MPDDARLALIIQHIVREQERLRKGIADYPVLELEYTARITGLNSALAVIAGALGIVGEDLRMRVVEWADERTQRVV